MARALPSTVIYVAYRSIDFQAVHLAYALHTVKGGMDHRILHYRSIRNLIRATHGIASAPSRFITLSSLLKFGRAVGLHPLQLFNGSVIDLCLNNKEKDIIRVRISEMMRRMD